MYKSLKKEYKKINANLKNAMSKIVADLSGSAEVNSSETVTETVSELVAA